MSEQTTVDQQIVGEMLDLIRSQGPDASLAFIRDVRMQLDALEAATVHVLRLKRWSWARIATSLGVSRQAACAKFGAGEH